MSDHTYYEELLAAHALGVLEPSDELAVLTHLDSCTLCAAELPGLLEAADELAWAAPSAPLPPDLKDRVLSEVRTTPQELFSISDDERVPSRPVRVSEPVVAAAPQPQVPALPRQRERRVLRTLVGSTLALVVALAGWNVSLQGDMETDRARIQLATAVEDLTRDPSTLRTGLVSAAGDTHGTALVGKGRTAVLAEDLPPLPEGSMYVVWAETPRGQLRAVTSFEVDAGGDATLVARLPGGEVRAVAVSLEPQGELPEQPSYAVARGVLST